ncbi:hypothetical protein PVAP13_2KG022216 [Panicum virgatum]|uniref:Uncharacterized protein n=1 Tax=Panicum virgatum TaxID=38727 RepID=A0A8T0VWR5_PANVG|nr:hypothetical protein PVAP13_2KG022216 [Panicum virgatum]
MQLERTCSTFQHSMHVYQLSIKHVQSGDSQSLLEIQLKGKGQLAHMLES